MGSLGRVGHEYGPLMIGISALIIEMQKTLFENTSETMPSMTQEAKLHQTLNILSP